MQGLGITEKQSLAEELGEVQVNAEEGYEYFDVEILQTAPEAARRVVVRCDRKGSL